MNTLYIRSYSYRVGEDSLSVITTLDNGEGVTPTSLGNARLIISSKTATEDEMLKWGFSVATDTHTQHWCHVHGSDAHELCV